jgi:FtsZ-binding cell division protein ZapB
MTPFLFHRTARRLGVTLAGLIIGAAATPSFAIPVMDMRIEDLVPMGPDFKNDLKLNSNQDRLWRQTESKTRQLVRERKARRERLEASLKQRLAAPNVELRDLVGAVDAETATSADEEKQLRSMWLEVNDALDEKQRQAVATFIVEQMQRLQDAGGPPAGGNERGGKGGKGGPGSGPPGGGMNGGSNGNGSVNMNFPGSF